MVDEILLQPKDYITSRRLNGFNRKLYGNSFFGSARILLQKYRDSFRVLFAKSVKPL